MTAAATAPQPDEGRRRFALPSAYTILFILIVIVAIATWIIPAGQYQVDEDGAPIPGTYARVDPNPQRIIIDSLMAPINGMYGIEGEDGRSASGTPASCSAPSTSRSSSSSSAGSSG